MNNLAAAVEHVEWCLKYTTKTNMLSYDETTVATKELETILAELGRLSVPVIDLDAIAYERIKKSIDIAHEFLPKEAKPHYELNYWVSDICCWLENRHKDPRPPALGELSDLTDEQWYRLSNVMTNAAMNSDIAGDSEAEEEKAVAKAARQFLGKVDG